MENKKESKKSKKKENADTATAPYKLRRAEIDKVIAGVAGGIGKYFNIDSTVIRLIFILLTIFGGGGILLYLVLWLIMPSPRSASMTTEDAIAENKEEIMSMAQKATESIRYQTGKTNKSREVFAIILVIFGVYFLLVNLGLLRFINIATYWPLVLVFLGVYILVTND